MSSIGIGALRGLVAGTILTQVLLTLILFISSFSDSSPDGGLFNFVLIVFYYFLLLIVSLVIGATLGIITGLVFLFFERGTKGWLAALIGGLVPLVCSVLFRLPQAALRDRGLAGILVAICVTFAIVGWQINNELRKAQASNNPPPFGAESIVSYILRAQKRWNSSRYDIDSDLLQQGYDPVAIEAAWKTILDEQLWVDDEGIIQKGKPSALNPVLGFLPKLTGGYTILYFMGLHFLSLFLTPLIFLPVILLTLAFLVIYRRSPRLARIAAKIRI
jgi:hypothetical protein